MRVSTLMRIYLPMILTFFFAAYHIAWGEPAKEVVLQKQLADQRSIVVYRSELPYVSPATQAPGGLVYIKPSHVYQYQFILRQSHIVDQILWSHRFLSFAPGDFLPVDFQILDLSFQDGTLIIVYKEANKTWGGTTLAQVINHATSSIREELTRNEALLTYDSDARQVFISKAKITGSLATNTLSVQLTNVNKLLLFAWKDHKWQQVIQETSPVERHRN